MTSPAYYNDTEPFVCSWLTNLVAGGKIAPGVVDARSITEITPHDLEGTSQAHFFAGIGGWSLALRRAGVPDHVPIWTGSCPCQPFSSAGQGLGFCDPRHLWPAWSALIEKCRPPIIFGEQVASADGLAWLDPIFADLERCGYTVGAADICAAGVGAPHNRSRLYFMAHTREGGRQVVGAPWLHDLRQPGHHAPGRGSDGDVADAAGRAGGLGLHGQPQGAADLGRKPTGPRGQRDAAEGARRDVGHAAQVGRKGAGQPRKKRAGRRVSARAGDGGCVGHARGHGDLEHAGVVSGDEAEHEVRAEIGYHAPIATGATGGFWADAEWVLCRDPDGPKWRPVRPGAFVLASGIPGRVGLLRGYGNSINIETAVEFICAGLEAIAETEGG